MRVHALVPMFALLLSACGGSSDRAPRFDTAFAVVNGTPDAIAGIAIQDPATGETYHAGPFVCAAGEADCRFFYAGPPIAGAADVSFVDERGVMVGAYRLAAAPGPYASLEVTRRSTGDYLITKLMRASPELWARWGRHSARRGPGTS